MPEARHIALGGVHVTKHEKWSQPRNDGREREGREEERKAGVNHSCLIRMAMAGREVGRPPREKCTNNRKEGSQISQQGQAGAVFLSQGHKMHSVTLQDTSVLRERDDKIHELFPRVAIMILSSPLQHCWPWIGTECHSVESYSRFCLKS